MKRQTSILVISVIAGFISSKNVYAQDKSILPPPSPFSPFSFQNQNIKDIKVPLIKVPYNSAMEVKPTLNLNQPKTTIAKKVNKTNIAKSNTFSNLQYTSPPF